MLGNVTIFHNYLQGILRSITLHFAYIFVLCFMSFKLFLLLSRPLSLCLCLLYTLAAVASACCLYKFLKYFRCFRCRWRSQTQCHGTCYLGLQRASANWIKLRKASAASWSPASFYVAYFAAPSSTSASAFSFIQLDLKVKERGEREIFPPAWQRLKRLI